MLPNKARKSTTYIVHAQEKFKVFTKKTAKSVKNFIFFTLFRYFTSFGLLFADRIFTFDSPPFSSPNRGRSGGGFFTSCRQTSLSLSRRGVHSA